MEEMQRKLETVLSPKRYRHSLNVMETAVRLAKAYGTDTDKAAIAGLLHDCARDIEGAEALKMCEQLQIETDPICRLQPWLLHGRLGAHKAIVDYGVEDREIFQAICCHTVGREGMTMLDKVVLLADYIEPGRNFEGVEEIRRMAAKDIDGAILLALDSTIGFELKKGSLLHPDTLKTRNYLLMERMNTKGGLSHA